MLVLAIPLMTERSRQEALRILGEHEAGCPGRLVTLRYSQHYIGRQRRVQPVRRTADARGEKPGALISRCAKSLRRIFSWGLWGNRSASALSDSISPGPSRPVG